MMLTNTNNPDIPKEKRLTEDGVIAQSTVFLLAGYETTSNALALVCHHLATEPGIQEKVKIKKTSQCMLLFILMSKRK